MSSHRDGAHALIHYYGLPLPRALQPLDCEACTCPLVGEEEPGLVGWSEVPTVYDGDSAWPVRFWARSGPGRPWNEMVPVASHRRRTVVEFSEQSEKQQPETHIHTHTNTDRQAIPQSRSCSAPWTPTPTCRPSSWKPHATMVGSSPADRSRSPSPLSQVRRRPALPPSGRENR